MVFPHKRIALSSWEFKAQNDTAPDNALWRETTIPSTIHQDLLAHGLIPDPFLAKNEESVQWVAEQTWTYRTTFTIPAHPSNHLNITKQLVFEGLDTYATVWLNGDRILEAENMFLTHRVDVSNSIRPHDESNILEITFDNAEKRGDEEVARHPEHDWRTFNSGAARLATRKAQYHYGWDWGPKLMTIGVWRPAYIACFEARIRDVAVRTVLNGDLDEAKIYVDAEIEGLAEQILVTIEQDNIVVASQTVSVSEGKAVLAIPVMKPKLWWPHTFGQQPLYNVKTTLLHQGQVCDSKTKRIGVRKIELVRRPFSDQEGSSFFFKINNVPIFGAGSNWIPGDSFLPRITPSKYRHWIKLARKSNQVMIRVWGGGIYEHEEFYNACDELGVLVWQDFMFACGMFPAYENFVEKIKIETEDNLRRLRHHASIVLWCGNNEDYVIPLISGIEYDAKETDPEAILRSPFPARYIYEHVFPDLCSRLVPDVPYWPGSPFGGDMINSTLEGDVHQWHVWHLEKSPYQDFPRLSGRFISEFGMQAMPCYRTTRDFFPAHALLEEGRNFAEDEFVQWHNKCDGGPETLHQYCEDNIPLDTRNLKKFIHATQLIQSETVATAYRSWRRLWRGEGKEFCGGALIWQLNDCWPVTSWALVDSHFRPKTGYFAMKRENKPITAGIQRTKTEDGTTTVEIWAVNTSLRDVTVDVHLQGADVKGGRRLERKVLHHNFVLPANKSTELGTINLHDLGISTTLDYKDIVIAVDLLTTSRCLNPNFPQVVPDKGTLISRSINFHEPLKKVPFQNPSSMNVKLLNDTGKLSRDLAAPASHPRLFDDAGKLALELLSDTALKGVYIDIDGPDDFADGVSWDDNGFDMIPGQAVRIGVTGLRVGMEGRLRISWLGGEWHAKDFSGLAARSLL